MRSLAGVTLLAILLASCTDEPYSSIQETKVAPDFTVKNHPFRSDGKTVADWWRSFADLHLEEIFTQAKANNHDLALAGERLREVAYSYGLNEPETESQVSGGEVTPKANAIPGVAAVKEAFLNAFMVGNNVPFSFSDKMQSKFNIRFFSGTFGIDIFNTIDHHLASAKHHILEHSELKTAVQSLIKNQLSKEYIQLRLHQNLIEAVNKGSQILKTHLGQLQERINAGLNPKQDAREGADFLQELNLLLIDCENKVEGAIANIIRLSGISDAEQLKMLRETNISIPGAHENLLAGTPIETIKNRADLRAKMKKLEQAASLVNVAVSEQYPSIKINAGLEASANAITKLLHGNNLSHALGVEISNSFLNSVNEKARLRVQRSKLQQAQLEYNKAVHYALTEVGEAMVNVISARKRDTMVRSIGETLKGKIGEESTLVEQDGKHYPELILAHKNKILADINSLYSSATVSTNMLDLLAALGG